MRGRLERDRPVDTPPAAPPVDSDFIAYHTGAPPRIDGRIRAAEWRSSSTYTLELVNDIGETTTAKWRFMSDARYLYVGIETRTSAHWDSVAGMAFDGDNDNSPSGRRRHPHQDFSVAQASPKGWTQHTSYVVIDANGSGTHVPPPNDLARASIGSSDVSYEFRIPISSFRSTTHVVAIRPTVYQGGLGASRYVFFYPAQRSVNQPTWKNVASWPRLRIQ